MFFGLKREGGLILPQYIRMLGISIENGDGQGLAMPSHWVRIVSRAQLSDNHLTSRPLPSFLAQDLCEGKRDAAGAEC